MANCLEWDREEILKQSIGVLKVWPENFWRDVWHDAPCRGIMKHHNQFRHVREEEDINVLRLFECMTCGTTFYAGLNKDRRIVVEAV